MHYCDPPTTLDLSILCVNCVHLEIELLVLINDVHGLLFIKIYEKSFGSLNPLEKFY